MLKECTNNIEINIVQNKDKKKEKIYVGKKKYPFQEQKAQPHCAAECISASKNKLFQHYNVFTLPLLIN
jgi:hypothetical protein